MQSACARVVAAGLVLSVATLFAGTYVNSGGTWLDVPTCTNGQPGCAVWQNPSQDDGLLPLIPGQSRDLSSIVNNTSPYGGLPAFSNVQWYGQQNGSLVQDLFLSGNDTYNVSLLVRETGNNLTLGWYSFDNTGNLVAGGVLFDGSSSTGTSVIVTPGAGATGFGFFMKYGRPEDCTANDWRAVCDGSVMSNAGGSGVPLDVFFTQTALNSSVSNPSPGAPAGFLGYESIYDPNRQHFLLLQSDQGMILGVEDSWTSLEQFTSLPTPHNGTVWERAGDFNDVVLQINAVPEPSTIVLLGAGMAALVAVARRRRSK